MVDTGGGSPILMEIIRKVAQTSDTMVTELIKQTLEFRSLSDNPDGSDENIDLGDGDEVLDDPDLKADDDEDDGEELMG